MLQTLAKKKVDERGQDLLRKRKKKFEGSEIFIPKCKNPERRAVCLEDPMLGLKTYWPERFYNPWADHHTEMIAAIWGRAKHGGDQAIAAPRGDGKTEITAAMAVLIILRCLVRFPIVIASTATEAEKIFKDIKSHFESNDILLEDFPEICVPVRELEGAPQRANKQHIDGIRTRIEWTQDHVVFPRVPGSPYGGMCLAYKGLDSAIRGVKYYGQRPDFALIDDPETEESAKSDEQIKWRERAIDRAIAGLAAPNKRIARVILTTIQNRKCVSFRFTDPKIKPSWNGKRYGAVKKFPNRTDLWEEYIALRQQDQSNGDEFGRSATAMYLSRKDEMEEGAIISNPYRFASVQKMPDGVTPIEYTALQAFYNRVADMGWGFALAELQNDPEDETQTETLGLTAGKVAQRVSGYIQGQLPPDHSKITVGIDVGKYWSHWTKIAWQGNAVGHIIDYGVMEIPGMSSATSAKAVQAALLPALLQWRLDITSTNAPDFVLIDSGDYTDSVYEFVRQVRTVFAAAKGWDSGRFRMGTQNDLRRLFHECHADYQKNEGVWLYNHNSEYWKNRVHEGFITAPRDDSEQWNAGSLTLFSAPEDKRKHLTFSHHIVAEEFRQTLLNGRMVRRWVQVNKNNHWLDATALACCAAGVLGIRVVPKAQTPRSVAVRKDATERPQSQFVNPYGQSFVATERR